MRAREERAECVLSMAANQIEFCALEQQAFVLSSSAAESLITIAGAKFI